MPLIYNLIDLFFIINPVLFKLTVNDKIKMYKKEKIKMYKVVHSCYLYLRRDSNGRQLKSTTKYNKSHGIKT